MNYKDFIRTKETQVIKCGFESDKSTYNKYLFDWQRDVVHWALLKGRALNLWTNPNDVILTPFMGIGSEVVTALENGRRAVGVELKDSYYRQAEKNARATVENEQMSLW